MRCFNCGGFALLDLCDLCEAELGEFSLGSRILEDDFKVYHFYKYSEIKHLLLSKHKFYGSFALNALAKISFAKFKDFFTPNELVNAVPLDDRVQKGLYSHSAILARNLKSRFVKPIFRVLHAKNEVKYSGKSIEFRRKNKRKFELLKKPKFPVILVDDIITTGLSLLEARGVLEENGVEVLFALVLADARE